MKRKQSAAKHSHSHTFTNTSIQKKCVLFLCGVKFTLKLHIWCCCVHWIFPFFCWQQFIIVNVNLIFGPLRIYSLYNLQKEDSKRFDCQNFLTNFSILLSLLLCVRLQMSRLCERCTVERVCNAHSLITVHSVSARFKCNLKWLRIG